MRGSRGIIILLIGVLLSASCAGNEKLASPRPIDLSEKFTSLGGFYSVVSDEGSIKDSPGNGFVTRDSVDPATGRVKVTVFAEDANNLKVALIKLTFPAESYHFVEAVYLGGLGGESEAISLAVQYEDAVYMGAAIIHFDEKEGKNGAVYLFEVTFAPGAQRTVSYSSGDSRAAPTGAFNAVTITGNIDENNIVHLSWYERNSGDGNNDSNVNISDITPIAQFFFSTGFDPNSPNGLADYNGDGIINIQEIARLAETFFTNLSGYDVEFSTDGGQNWQKIPHPGDTQPTLVRSELFGTPSSTLGRLEWTYDSEPVEGTYTYRVVPRANNGDEGVPSENTLEFTGIVQFEEVQIELPDGHPGYLLITEEAIDEVVGNEQEFVLASVQLSAMGKPVGGTEFVDGTERVNWMITASPNSAQIANTSPGKGLLTAKDIGVVTVFAFDPDDILASDALEVPIYAISAIELKEQSQTEPANVTVPKGGVVDFIATGIFDDNDSDAEDTLRVDLTPYVGWIVQRPVTGYDGNNNPIYETGTFYVDTVNGRIFTQAGDAEIQSGFRAFVSTVFPPLEEQVTIGDGHRPVSNTITITIQ